MRNYYLTLLLITLSISSIILFSSLPNSGLTGLFVLVFIASLAISIISFVLSIAKNFSRISKLEKFTTEKKFSYQDRNDSKAFDLLTRFNVELPEHKVKGSNIIEFTTGESSITALDLTYMKRFLKYKIGINHSVICIKNPVLDVGSFKIAPKNNFLCPKFIDKTDDVIKPETKSMFFDKFKVASVNHEKTLSILSHDFEDFLLSNEMTIIGSDDELLLIKLGDALSAEKIANVPEQTKRLLAILSKTPVHA